MLGIGLSAFFHDSAVTLLKDGIPAFAAEEERFSRIKHDNRLPEKSLAALLAHQNISISDVDWLAYYEKPLLRFERALDWYIKTFPFSFSAFMRDIPDAVSMKIRPESLIRRASGFKGPFYYVPHHLSHASAAFYTSAFKSATIVTIDGVGEYDTVAIWRGEGTRIEKVASLHFPHSIGLWYSAFTSYLGFRVNFDEYHVMGLAGTGAPAYVDEIRRTITSRDDGSFVVEDAFFDWNGSRLWKNSLEELLGPARDGTEPLTRRHADIAASVQRVFEECVFSVLRRAYEVAPSDNLCLGGGSALNAVMNGRVLGETPFKKLAVFGVAGDSGAALGAALHVHHGILGNRRNAAIYNLDLGTSYDESAIEMALKESGVSYERVRSREVHAANSLARGAHIGWFQGRMEFGPRALGNRSILALPRSDSVRDTLNRLKRRQAFRPFGALVPETSVSEYFDCAAGSYPFMNICVPARPITRTHAPAIVHADGSSRIQTISATHDISRIFDHLGKHVPILLNTSFNGHDEPVVETPAQAVSTFKTLGLDALYIGNFVIRRGDME